MMQPVEPTTMLSATLEAQQWNIVLGALSTLAWRDANPVIAALRQQLEANVAEGEQPNSSRPNGVDKVAAHV